MAPTPPRTVMHPPADLTADRTGRPPATQRHAHHDALAGKQNIDDAGAPQRQQTVECGGDAHVVLLGRSLSSLTPSSLSERAVVRVPQRLNRLQQHHRGRKPLQLAALQASADPHRRPETRILVLAAAGIATAVFFGETSSLALGWSLFGGVLWAGVTFLPRLSLYAVRREGRAEKDVASSGAKPITRRSALQGIAALAVAVLIRASAPAKAYHENCQDLYNQCYGCSPAEASCCQNCYVVCQMGGGCFGGDCGGCWNTTH